MRWRIKANTPAQKAAFFGVLLALAVALSFAENALLPFTGLPPGVKPGLSNIAVMVCAQVLGAPTALLLALCKGVFAGITRGSTAFLMSCAGGLLSAGVTGGLLRFAARRNEQSKLAFAAIGVCGALTHNAAQLCVCAVLMQSFNVFWQAPVLLVSASAGGVLTGLILSSLRALRRNS